MLTLSCPGKTFLAGEYLALDGGLALLAQTSPRFEMSVAPGAGTGARARAGIPANSPADRLLRRRGESLAAFDIEFRDPHAGAGGWGASTAQYLLTFAALKGAEIDERELLEEYRIDAWDGRGRPPSGADLVGQSRGGFTFFDRSKGTIATEPWPFADVDGFVIRTGEKLATHEHLAKLGAVDTSAMAAVMADVRASWEGANADGFAEAIREYGRVLQSQRLVAEPTLSLLHDLLWLDGVKAAKGCGAMGADVVFAVVAGSARRNFENWLADQGRQGFRLADRVSGGLELAGELK